MALPLLLPPPGHPAQGPRCRGEALPVGLVLRLCLLCCCLGRSGATVILHQVVVGSGANQAVQLLNTLNENGTAQDLARFSILRADGRGNWSGGSWGPFSGFIYPGTTFTIANALSTTFQQVANVTFANFTINGTIALALGVSAQPFSTAHATDAFGDPSQIQPFGWMVNGVAGATVAHTLVRKPEVLKPSLDWTAESSPASSQWFVYPEDTLEGGTSSCGQRSISAPLPSASAMLTVGTWTLPNLTLPCSNESQCLLETTRFGNATHVLQSYGGEQHTNLSNWDVYKKARRNNTAFCRFSPSNTTTDLWNIIGVTSCQALSSLGNQSFNSYLPLPPANAYPSQQAGLLTIVPFSSAQTDALQQSVETVPYPVQNSSCRFNGTAGVAQPPSHFISRLTEGLSTIAIIGMYLQAGPGGSEGCAIREAQATIMKNTAQGILDLGQEVIIMGDLNDFDETAPDASNDRPVSQALHILQSVGMINVAGLLSTTDIYTYISNTSHKQQIDYVLVSPGLLDAVAGYPPIIANQVSQLTNGTPGTHFPIIVHIDTSKVSTPTSAPPPSPNVVAPSPGPQAPLALLPPVPPPVSASSPAIAPTPFGPAPAPAVYSPSPSPMAAIIPPPANAPIHNKSSSTNIIIPIVAALAGCIGLGAALVLLLLYRRTRFSRRALTRDPPLSLARSSRARSTRGVQPAGKVTNGSGTPPLGPSHSINSIDRALHTIKSGEELALEDKYVVYDNEESFSSI